MLKRLLIGLIKGLLIGGAIGAGLQYGLHWTLPSGGLLGYLLTMGAAGTTGVFAGRPPWRDGAWIEALLKGLVGVGVGALVYWLCSRFGALPIPYPGLAEPVPWTALPAVFVPTISGLYGSLVELDNTGDDNKKGGGNTKKKPGAARLGPFMRVPTIDDEEIDVSVDDTVERDPGRTVAAKPRR
jgi:hypothetical protein